MFYLLDLVIKLKFPRVKPINISELTRWLDEETLPIPLIIDARSQEEYAVSHIKSAQLLESENSYFIQ